MPKDSEISAFVRAIHLAPDDDAPRLVFADYLDEHGQHDRARLIRWMCRVPSYLFTWNQSRWAKRPKHEHKEEVKAIRGLKPRLSVLCREEWGPWRGVEQITMRRGFGESITLPSQVFLATAGELFAAHPFQAVTLPDLRTRNVWRQYGAVEASVSEGAPLWDHWPAALFPEMSPGTAVRYSNYRVAMADLSARAAGYGRRMAGVVREPPPLPLRTSVLRDRCEQVQAENAKDNQRIDPEPNVSQKVVAAFVGN